MGGGRAVFGVFLGITIVVVAIVAGKRWLPTPGKDIEWVHGESSIIVQMKTVNATSGGPSGDMDRRLGVPEFTLYGDGRLIAKEAATNRPYRLMEGKMSARQIRNLLTFIEDTGFSNFSYEQPSPKAVNASSTYFYVSSKLAANAVRADELDSEPPEEGSNWYQFRKLREIKERLVTIRDALLVAPVSEDYMPDAVELVVQKSDKPEGVVGSLPNWPIREFDLVQIVDAGAGSGELMIESRAADELPRRLAEVIGTGPLYGAFDVDGQTFLAGFRPVLPHEDNFPEFEPPQ